MRGQIVRLLRSTKSLSSLPSRRITTSSDPRKASGLAIGVKEIPQQWEIQSSFYPPLEYPESDLFSFAFRNLKHWPNKTFTECALTGRTYTYNQTLDAALRWGAAIQKLLPNVPNPTIALIVPNSPDYVTMFLGSLAAGATVTSVNPIYTAVETANQLRESGADLVVVESELEPLADGALKLLGRNLPVVVNGQSSNGRPNAQEVFFDTNAKMLEPTELDPNSVAFIPYSSGTTGKPKGVKITHQAMVNNLMMMTNGLVGINTESFGDHQDIQLGVLPFYHIFGTMATLLPGIYYGIKTITLPKFDPELFINTLKKNKITSFQLVPILLQFMSSFPMVTKEDLQHVHSFICGAAPLAVDTALSIYDKAPQAIVQEGYGMSETLITHVTPKDNVKLGYCGQLLSNLRAKVVDLETGEMLPPNTPGELLIHSPSSMIGYHNNEEATIEAFDEDGYVRTGDVAIYTEDGFYAIVDRIKELIKVKGLQVSPTEVEETLQKHPGVFEAGVVGVPHQQFGEAPMAFIVKSDDDVTEEQIHAFVSENLSKHKQLIGGIKFVDELPKNQTGKLLRRVLKDMLNDN